MNHIHDQFSHFFSVSVLIVKYNDLIKIDLSVLASRYQIHITDIDFPALIYRTVSQGFLLTHQNATHILGEGLRRSLAKPDPFVLTNKICLNQHIQLIHFLHVPLRFDRA